MDDFDDQAQMSQGSERDVLERAVEELERVETASDDERLTALEGVHARLSDELDAPAGEPLAP